MKKEHYIEKAIVQLFSLKLRTGSSLEDLEAFAHKCLKLASRTTSEKPEYRGLDIHRLGSVLRTWHKDSEYLTFDGLPRPLKIEGNSGLKDLVRKFYSASKFDEVFKRLIETKLIQNYGDDAWIPSGRTARIPQLSHETLEHLSEGVARYVETVTRNVTAKREEDVLFERSCKVTRLPAKEFDAFREYVAQQALAFLTAVDDWLESRSAASKGVGSTHCTAGVYTFAYMAANSKARRKALKQ